MNRIILKNWTNNYELWNKIHTFHDENNFEQNFENFDFRFTERNAQKAHVFHVRFANRIHHLE